MGDEDKDEEEEDTLVEGAARQHEGENNAQAAQRESRANK